MTKIIFYDSKDTNFNINNKKYIDMHKLRSGQLLNYYKGGIINPPFVNKIIVMCSYYTADNIRMLYNTLNMNGKLCLINVKNYQNIFNKYTTYKKYIIIRRMDNYIYIFPQYRIIEFIIMGTQKGGTTALAYNISKHPDIYIDNDKDPTKSETHFFSINWVAGIEYYKTLFDYSKKVVGEKTPSLMYLSHTFPLIQQINPYIKIIIILRNPANRAFSHYKMIKDKWGAKSFEEEIEDEMKYRYTQNITFAPANRHFIRRGFYHKQLLKLFKWFPKHNILILLQEEILKDMKTEYNKVFEFLNINKIDNIKYESIHETKNTDKINIDTYNKLMTIYKEDILKLEELLNIKTNWI